MSKKNIPSKQSVEFAQNFSRPYLQSGNYVLGYYRERFNAALEPVMLKAVVPTPGVSGTAVSIMAVDQRGAAVEVEPDDVLYRVTNGRGQPRGIVLIYKDGQGRLNFGYSLTDKRDQFNRYVGVYHAIKFHNHKIRKNSFEKDVKEALADMPHSLRGVAESVVERARKFFRV